MTAAQVEIAIVEALDGKIPPGVDIEILMSMHTSLVAPSLAPGQQGIDGAIVQRLFQTKPIYVRPSRQILMSSKKWYNRYEVCVFTTVEILLVHVNSISGY